MSDQPASGAEPSAAPSNAEGAPGSRETASARIAELSADSAWMASYLGGDKAKVAEFRSLHEAAYPTGAAGAQTNAEVFGPPADPEGYGIEAGPDATEEQRQEVTEIKQALFAEGVPNLVAEFAGQLFERNGALTEDVLTKRRLEGWAELERRHGAKAPEILADGKKLYDALVARSASLEYLLESCGAGSDAGFIETLARVQRSKPAR